MAKISISMSDKMEKYVADRVESGDFNNTSEYFRDLVRRDQSKQDAEANLKIMMERSLKSGLSKRTPQEIWGAAEERYKKEKHKRGASAK
ncbi:MAG TPA: type II toxin-antitoxin system ParD family antitoxin [Hyphomonadaceae bacterium]|jgi:antitoxin ParD1/3/4|nr:type II toxin-antitoxin system ParD family antitoxin [Hyphomonadaceae bacterium]